MTKYEKKWEENMHSN